MSSVERQPVLTHAEPPPVAVPVTSVRARDRIVGIDAARGAAMLFACLAHFGEGYFAPRHNVLKVYQIDHVGMVASPTFMILSGAMLGLLYRKTGDRFPATRDKLIDRGLWMLTIGHLIILGAHVSLTPSLDKLWRWEFITDSIAASIILGPLLIGYLTARARLAASILLFVASWVILLSWHPTNFWVLVLKDSLTGNDLTTHELDVLPYNFPLLPWFAVYFGGTVIGEWLSTATKRMTEVDIARRCFAGAAVALVTAFIVFKAGRYGPYAVRMLTSPYQKFPPGPVYLLSYGGLGLAIGGLCLAASRYPAAQGVTSRLATIGRSSLFVFIFQYYLYFAILYRLPYAPSWAWPVVFGLSLWLVLMAATWWDRRGYIRLLTVGYGRANRR